jgi:hypothetical protein
MCLNEEVSYQEVLKTRTEYRNETVLTDWSDPYHETSSQRDRYGSFRFSNSHYNILYWNIYWNDRARIKDIKTKPTNGKIYKDGIGNEFKVSSCDSIGSCAVSVRNETTESVPYEIDYYEAVEVKSENYDYCVNKGYPTAN